MRREHFIEGFHGRVHPAEPQHSDRPLYVSPEREYAQDYTVPTAEHGEGAQGRLYHVSFQAQNPLVFTRAAPFHEAWMASKADEAPGGFHEGPATRFATWAREQGHDAVVLRPEAFNDPEASHEHWETLAGTFGDPQSIILDPRRVKARRLK